MLGISRVRASSVLALCVALANGVSVAQAQTAALVPVAPAPAAAAQVKTTVVPVVTASRKPLVAVPKAEPAAAQGAAKPEPVEKAGGDKSRTRFVIGVEKNAEFQVFSLSNPNRVIVQIAETQLRLPEPMTGPVGLVKSFTGGLAGAGRSRVEIDVIQPVIVEGAKFEKTKDGKGLQLALDIVPVDGTRPRRVIGPLASGLGAGAVPPPAAAAPAGAVVPAVAGMQPPVPRPAVSPKVQAARAFKPTIVIDPGHGGHDSGATKFGAVEKDVVLAFSLMLRDKLVASGRYNVLMTRDTDVFIPLDNRRDFGDKHKAALFIAVHADYAGSGARGATIYSLREGVASQMQRSAKGEATANILTQAEVGAIRQSKGNVQDVEKILAGLAADSIESTKDRTNFFSRIVIDNMSEATTMRQSPDQQAAFRVLKSGKVPSVLIELAYVSNAQDAKNLKSDQWRGKVSDTIVSAIDNFCSNQIARPAL